MGHVHGSEGKDEGQQRLHYTSTDILHYLLAARAASARLTASLAL